MAETGGYAWRIFHELRAEALEAQKIRAQIIQVKITTIGVAIGIVLGVSEPAYALLALPAFAAVFFDFLVNSYSVSIKRIGLYTREVLEPEMQRELGWPAELPMWERFMSARIARQHYSDIGNLGLTLLVCVIGFIGLFRPFDAAVTLPATAALLIVLGLDVVAYLKPRRMFSSWHFTTIAEL